MSIFCTAEASTGEARGGRCVRVSGWKRRHLGEVGNHAVIVHMIYTHNDIPSLLESVLLVRTMEMLLTICMRNSFSSKNMQILFFVILFLHYIFFS